MAPAPTLVTPADGATIEQDAVLTARIAPGSDGVLFEVCVDASCRVHVDQQIVKGAAAAEVSIPIATLPAGALFWRARAVSGRTARSRPTAVRRFSIHVPVAPPPPDVVPVPTLTDDEIAALITRGDFAGIVTATAAIPDAPTHLRAATALIRAGRCSEAVEVLDQPQGDDPDAPLVAARVARDCRLAIATEDIRDALARSDQTAAFSALVAFEKHYPGARDLMWANVKILLETDGCDAARVAAYDAARESRSSYAPDSLLGEVRDFDGAERDFENRCATTDWTATPTPPSRHKALLVRARVLGRLPYTHDHSPLGPGLEVSVGSTRVGSEPISFVAGVIAIDPGHLNPDGRLSGIWGASGTFGLLGLDDPRGLSVFLNVLVADGEFRGDGGREHGAVLLGIGGGVGYHYRTAGGWTFSIGVANDLGAAVDYTSATPTTGPIDDRVSFIKGAELNLDLSWSAER